MNAYELSNMRHKIVDEMAVLSNKIVSVNRSKEENKDISLSILEVESITDILCDVNTIFKTMLENTIVANTEQKLLPF